MTHSLAPKHAPETPPRVRVGGPACTQPYSASHLNISAMSFGSLGKNSVLALNQGARLGGFAHNTGEGGISPYHLEPGGDLTWQVGTGYFGCRTLDGDFNPELFKENASQDAVKMIEIKACVCSVASMLMRYSFLWFQTTRVRPRLESLLLVLT